MGFDGIEPTRRTLLGTLGAGTAALGVGGMTAATGDRDHIDFEEPYGRDRELAVGEEYAAATGTPWATDAALDVFEDGGNAFDAAIAGLLVVNVTFGEAASFPGVAPTLIQRADGEPEGYIGAGTAPQEATLEHFRQQGYGTMPTMSIESQLLPASPDVAVALLREEGTMSFERVARPAIGIAREGFPIHRQKLENLDFSLAERLGFYVLMPYNVEVYLNGRWWKPLEHGQRFTRPDLADTFEELVAVEQAALDDGASREAALDSVREYFYGGPIAERIVDFHDRRDGLFTRSDLAEYEGGWETPLSVSFGDYTVYTNDTWCQGPALAIALNILDGVDLESMGHNSPEYVHTVLQAIELAMADREAYFGDPEFVDVPIAGLLDPEYAAERRAAMTETRAFPDMPMPGDPYPHDPEHDGPVPPRESLLNEGETGGPTFGNDTSYVTTVDAAGNAVSLTVSDFPETPMVPGTGLTLGNRMQQFRLDPEHPTALEPGKRPRISPNPALAEGEDGTTIAFGTPGGDMQVQAMLQSFLNMVVFDMDAQAALDAYRFESRNFPDSFAPHGYDPGTVRLERSLADQVAETLEAMAYDVEVADDRPPTDAFGSMCVTIHGDDGVRAAADPRGVSWANADDDRYFE